MPRDSRQPKQATEDGFTTFLMEEVADARLRCNQLKSQINEAVNIIEKSGKRDHFFEVAGHLIHGIPDTLMRVEKSLDATAMALAKWTYETLKDDLRPEKADQLEDALKDVRTRRVRRKSTTMPTESAMNTVEAREALVRIASAIEKTGYVNTARLAALIARLEGRGRTASSSKAELVTVLRDMASALGSRDAALRPGRNTVASVLRRVLAEAIDVRTAADEVAAEKEAKFPEGKSADPTKNMDEEDAKEWAGNTEKYKDKFKEASARFAEEDEDEEETKEAYDWKA